MSIPAWEFDFWVGDRVRVKGHDMVVESVRSDQVTLVTVPRLEFRQGRWYAQRAGRAVYCCGHGQGGRVVCQCGNQCYHWDPNGVWDYPTVTPEWDLVREVEAPSA